MDCLSTLSEVEQVTPLSSIGFRYHEYNSENERLNAIYNFTLKNFMKKIELKEVAAITRLIPNSFCRYFKTRTGKTYNQFLLEIRIGYACKLLLDNTQSVKQVCFESGFNNFSCFHKSFKSITGYTPQGYLNAYLKKQPAAGRIRANSSMRWRCMFYASIWPIFKVLIWNIWHRSQLFS